MKTKFKNKNGTLTAYSLMCGYVESKGESYSDNYVMLYMEHTVYHVKGAFLGNKFWFTFDTLTSARKQYNTLKV